MNYRITTRPTCTVIGLAIRTTNQCNRAQKDIGELWNSFFKQGILDLIPHKTDNSIVVLYTDYEGDFTKPYTCIIGCTVQKYDHVPNGMIVKTIPEATYATFEVLEPLPHGIVKTWKQIWNLDLKREYSTDLEIYSPFSQNPHETEATIFVAINTKEHYVAKKKFTLEEAKRIGDKLGITWKEFDVDQFRRGLDIELEHGSRDSRTNVTQDDQILTGKIAWAHLIEFPDYYDRLEIMEKEAEKEWESKRK